jgi:hypothetical protein
MLSTTTARWIRAVFVARGTISMAVRLVTAFFPGRVEADAAMDRLFDRGIAPGEVHVLPKHVSHVDDIGLRMTNKAALGAAVGALAGGVGAGLLGGILGAGALMLPNLGTVLVGPLVAALACAGAGGAIFTVVGAALGARLPAYEAAYLDDAIGRGGSLVAVRCDASNAGLVADILDDAGGLRVRAVHSR